MTPKGGNEDPFDVFGDDDDAEGDGNDMEDGASSGYRDPSNGVLNFHHGTEQAMLHYVRNELEKRQNQRQQQQQEQQETSPSSSWKRKQILEIIDQFCYSRHWMMHVGPEKGLILEQFLLQSFDAFLRRREEQKQAEATAVTTTANNTAGKGGESREDCFVLVEIGTYCGYSILRMANTLLERIDADNENSDRVGTFHIFTVDIHRDNIDVAREIIRMAGLDSHVSFLLLPPSQPPASSKNSAVEENRPKHNARQQRDRLNDDDDDVRLATILKSSMEETFGDKDTTTTTTIDFAFLDHDKRRYLSDLLQLESNGMIRTGTHVAADNVVFHQIHSYRQHVNDLYKRGVVETALKLSRLEYVVTGSRQKQQQRSDGNNRNNSKEGGGDDEKDDPNRSTEAPGRNLQDGLELTVYLKDP